MICIGFSNKWTYGFPRQENHFREKASKEKRQISMVGMLVPVKAGMVGSMFHPPRFGKDYKWYISGIFPANWGMDYATYLPPFTGTRNNH